MTSQICIAGGRMSVDYLYQSYNYIFPSMGLYDALVIIVHLEWVRELLLDIGELLIGVKNNGEVNCCRL